MGLSPCRECSTLMSTEAPYCVKCGCPSPSARPQVAQASPAPQGRRGLGPNSPLATTVQELEERHPWVRFVAYDGDETVALPSLCIRHLQPSEREAHAKPCKVWDYTLRNAGLQPGAVFSTTAARAEILMRRLLRIGPQEDGNGPPRHAGMHCENAGGDIVQPGCGTGEAEYNVTLVSLNDKSAADYTVCGKCAERLASSAGRNSALVVNNRPPMAGSGGAGA